MQNSISETVIAYIGLGSNLQNPIEQIHSARAAITALVHTKEQGFSCLYQSLPMGPQDQPDYVNAVMAVVTDLSPIELLRALQAIENNQGRVRGERWGARTLDLDILLYGDQVIELPDLIIPHVGLTERAFVLYPLYEIAPQLIIPNKGKLVDLLVNCPLEGLKRLA
ncbi:MAG: 2-amino-4-hydroxy-6-hydroxymethyldihydropteridine diphosphokinase [Methylococcaceae bacterium]|nr:2-amino-4-hydroxy-6-hydroxymethyldihydropteridine diphosphokinase [Methylococcaceae bacterium]MDD1609252.1 2-amino-4-hydroxy-6-hydroxymethyldihydropteridine diphosphokinase [Methylococcaceae bacterium]MDD1615409.1 2-amino-4-hydroxy-6-hydroxymethyldihydropteridine diphosphokinase [Methylococcaceae bacterium]OYV20410.1 MAG: 2-amino-4-hydroxy-6-hydroxymethyldihydropteridine diphosphokinase [Methylococcaceae bacterium NSP1-2]